ncbi:WxcM-like domain-containing protein [Tenacibaculum sp. E3R01]|uniref:WxcM-like domain-containing protein n=1 Tax=Tenacibaculum sp. E3R01 TaxID=2267227 RepID=UPI001F48FBC7|nr:WxcM-like domain-containing protein [Tenacibaculum sp. E3R01]
MEPEIIKGNCFIDERGKLLYNNSFDADKVRRLYSIENKDVNFHRGWQGHKIQQRWFQVLTGSFEIRLIKLDNWYKPSKNLEQITFRIDYSKMDVLHVPKGFANCIKAIEDNSKLLVMSDYLFGVVDDEYKFDSDYFKI